jgi:CHAT domain-containing protein
MHNAAVAHLACHAKIRVASPLFSSLELYDGPATAYDLERLQTPSLVVLSACSSGITAQRTKGEVLGLATVFLDAGTKSLVAATIPLPDELTVDVMTTFHTQLRDGKTVAESLAHIVANSDMGTPEGLITACALTCFGRGDWTYPARQAERGIIG